jgi:hypothetical protein
VFFRPDRYPSLDSMDEALPKSRVGWFLFVMGWIHHAKSDSSVRLVQRVNLSGPIFILRKGHARMLYVNSPTSVLYVKSHRFIYVFFLDLASLLGTTIRWWLQGRKILRANWTRNCILVAWCLKRGERDRGRDLCVHAAGRIEILVVKKFESSNGTEEASEIEAGTCAYSLPDRSKS